jgi:enoyl-CoA hydratase/carnithine racemase
MANYPDIGLALSGHVATIEIQRPPNNFFDVVLINSIADALHDLDNNDQCRAVVLAAQGKAFCAGANFGDGSTLNREGQRPGEAMTPIGHIYIQAVRLFRSKKPIVGAINLYYLCGGLGL